MSRFFAFRSSRACLGLVALVAIGMGSHRFYCHYKKCDLYESLETDEAEYNLSQIDRPIGRCGMMPALSPEKVASMKDSNNDYHHRCAEYHQAQAAIFASAKFRVWESIPPRFPKPNPYDD